MIEREFINQKTKEYYIKKYIENKLEGVGISQIVLKKIPLGEKIIIHTSRPSLIVGSKGSNIKALTKALKTDFKLENPQIEISEVKNIFLDPQIVADRIANSLERFGSARFKGIGHKVMESVINAGALGIEVIISGKIPGARAKSWRFYQGYLKKCGDIVISGVRKAQKTALLKSGIIGIKVAIMPADLVLPDDVEILSEPVQVQGEIASEEVKKIVVKKSTRGTARKKAEKIEALEVGSKSGEKARKRSSSRQEKVVEAILSEEEKLETEILGLASEKKEPLAEEKKETNLDLVEERSKDEN